MNINKFINNLRTAREQAKMTLQELADRLGVSKNTVFRWEKGERNVGVDDLINISKVLNKDSAWFLQIHSSIDNIPQSKESEFTYRKKVENTPEEQYNSENQDGNMNSGDRSSRNSMMEVTRQEMKDGIEEVANALNRLAGIMEKIEERNEERHKETRALLGDILKEAEQNEKLAELNYLLEIGEISEEEARRRLMRPGELG